MSQPITPPAAGWYPDPRDGGIERWWNGLAWTATTRHVAVAPLPRASPADVVGAAPAPSATVPWQAVSVPPRMPAVNPYGTPGPYHAVQLRDPAYGGMQPAGYPPTYRMVAPALPVRGMGDAVRAVFGKYATFDGRAGRAEFWYWALLNALISVGALAILLIAFASVVLAFFGVIVYLAVIGWSLAVLIPNLAVSVRRLRDAGYHWAFMFLAIVPFGSIVLIILWAQPTRWR